MIRHAPHAAILTDTRLPCIGTCEY